MTLEDLYNRALQRLQVLSVGMDASAEDRAIVAEKYTMLYDMLITKGMVSWTATEAIPDYASLPIIAMLAWTCMGVFEAPAEMKQALTLEGALDLPQPSLAERQLRRQLAKNYVSYAAQSDYF